VHWQGLEKIKVHIRKLAPYSQKSLAHEQTKDLSVVAWVAYMKPFWIISIFVCVKANVYLAIAAFYHHAI
jgi:hypothetical protein